MKKLITAISFILFAASLFLPVRASAANAGIKPGSFFYFFDTTFEKLNLFFTRDHEKKARKALGYAEERLAEAKAIENDNRPQDLTTVITKYREDTFLATQETTEIKDKAKRERLLSTIADQAFQQQEVLVEVYNKAPEQSREIIKKVIDGSIKAQEEALKMVQALREDLSGQNAQIESLRKEVDTLKKGQGKPNIIEKIIEVRPVATLQNAKKLDSEEIYTKIAPAVALVETSDGSGSGIVIENDGIILTNAHVVAGTTRATVKINDSISTASVLGRDENVDLALLKINRSNLPIVDLGDSSEAALKRGEEVFAFGYPLDFQGDVTATRGILSARQVIDGVAWLQTDASIHPGNSGGPLVNNKGQVIGINSKVLSAKGKGGNIGGTGIGFAIPVNVARGLIPDLKAGRNVVVPKVSESISLPTPQPFTLPLPSPQPTPLPPPRVFIPPPPPPPLPPPKIPFEFNPQIRVGTSYEEFGHVYISIVEPFDACDLRIRDINGRIVVGTYDWMPSPWWNHGRPTKPGETTDSQGGNDIFRPNQGYTYEFICEKLGFLRTIKKGDFTIPPPLPPRITTQVNIKDWPNEPDFHGRFSFSHTTSQIENSLLKLKIAVTLNAAASSTNKLIFYKSGRCCIWATFDNIIDGSVLNILDFPSNQSIIWSFSDNPNYLGLKIIEGSATKDGANVLFEF